MRYVKCNLCGSDEDMLIESHRKGRYGKPGAEVRAVICKTCGLVYLNPQLDDVELNDLYSTNYAGTSLEAPDEKLVQMKETGVERILEWLEKRVNLADKAGKVLDVGCGMGSLLGGLQKRGWDIYGVEPAPGYAQFARDRYGAEVITGFLDDVSLPGSYFDMVTLGDTFEHFPDPTQTLTRIRSLLKDGGLIYIKVPNITKHSRLRAFDAPHLYSYSPNSLSSFLRKTGFEPIEIEDGGNIQALAKKGDISPINFSSQGDDYKKIISHLRWRYVYLMPVVVKGWLIRTVSLSIRRIFGEQRGRKILELIKKLVPVFRG